MVVINYNAFYEVAEIGIKLQFCTYFGGLFYSLFAHFCDPLRLGILCNLYLKFILWPRPFYICNDYLNEASMFKTVV